MDYEERVNRSIEILREACTAADHASDDRAALDVMGMCFVHLFSVLKDGKEYTPMIDEYPGRSPRSG